MGIPSQCVVYLHTIVPEGVFREYIGGYENALFSKQLEEASIKGFLLLLLLLGKFRIVIMVKIEPISLLVLAV